MVKIRICVDEVYNDYEIYASCHECGIDLAVIPPKRVLAEIDAGIEDAGLTWTDESYIYCPVCQKKYDYPNWE